MPSRSALRTPRASSSRAEMRDRLDVRRDAGRADVEGGLFGRDERAEGRLPARRSPSRDRVRRALRARRARAAPTSLRGACRTRCKRAGDGEVLERILGELVRRANSTQVGERSRGERGFETFVRCASPKPRMRWKPSRARRRASTKLQHSLALTSTGLHDDAVAARIVDQHFGRIESHRLHVEDRRAERSPARGISRTPTRRRAARNSPRAIRESRNRRSLRACG